MKKLLLIIAVLLFLSITAGTFYFNSIFLPTYLTKLVNEKGEYMLGRRVTFGKITYGLRKGIVITDLCIAQKDDPKQTLFEAKQISSKIPLMPLLKNKQILLQQITVQDFSADIWRNEYNDWNFSDLLRPKYAPVETRYKILLGKVVLSHGRVSATDQTNTFETTQLAVKQLAAAFSLPNKINFSLDANIDTDQSGLKISGTCLLKKKSKKIPAGVSVDIKAQITNLDLTKKVFPLLPVKVPFQQAFVKSADLTGFKEGDHYEVHGDISADLQSRIENFTAKGAILSKGTHFVYSPEHIYFDLDHLSSDNITLGLENGLSYSGSIAAETVKTTYEDEKFSLKAPSVTATPSSIGSKDLAFSTESISLSNIKAAIEDGKISAEAALAAPAFSFDRKGTHVTGDLSSPVITLSRQEDQWKISAPFSLQKGLIKQKDLFIINGALKCDLLDIVLDKERLDISGVVDGTDLAFTLPGKRTGTITPTTSFKIIQDRTQLNDFSYDISTDIAHARVLNAFPQFQELKNIHGKTHITNGNISFENLLMDIGKTDIAVSGELRTFSRLIADLSISAKNIRTEDWQTFIQPYLEPYGINIDGMADVTLQVSGPLTPPGKPLFGIEATLRESKVSFEKSPYVFTKVNGFFKYQKDIVAWDDLKFALNDEPYTTSGSLKDFSAPLLTFKLKSPSIFFTANAESVEGVYNISRMDLKTKTSALSATGRLKADPKFPYAQLNATGELDISDLRRIPLVRKKIDEWNLRGQGTVDINYAGNLTDPANARFSLDYRSAYTGIKNLRFENVSFQAQQTDPLQDSFLFVSKFYEGGLSVKANAVLKEDFPVTVKVQGMNVNITRLKNDFSFRDKPLGGFLTADLYLEGPAKNTAAMTGQGRIKIEKGYFTKTHFLKGVLALILNAESQDATFTDARAKFFIRDNKAKLQDIFLGSKIVQLTGNGWIDINKNIDLTITPNFVDSSSVKPFLLKTSTQDLLEKYMTIRVTGTLNHPKYSSNIDPAAVAQDAADMIGDGVQNLFNGLGL